MVRRLWQYLQKHKELLRLSARLYNLFMRNRVKVKKGNQIDNRGAFLKKCKIKIKGKNNTIILEPGVRLNGCYVNMSGNDAVLHIRENSFAESQRFHFEDNACEIRIGEKCVFSGGEFAVAEDGCKIIIGNDCLFSRDIHIVTTDSHSILDKSTQKRINMGQSVEVGNHVWLAAGVALLKGSKIPSGCVVGRHAVVTKKFEQENGVIVGCPGKYVKENVEWKAERL